MDVEPVSLRERVLVEDIAAAADVAPRTFNNYFSKASVVDQSLQHIADGLPAPVDNDR
jgi:AcrR family transcriptional regulator